MCALNSIAPLTDFGGPGGFVILPKRLWQMFGQQGKPVFTAFAGYYFYLVVYAVYINQPYVAQLVHAQAEAIK